MASLTDQLKPVTSRWQHRSIACIVHGQQDGFLPAAVPRQLLALVTLDRVFQLALVKSNE